MQSVNLCNSVSLCLFFFATQSYTEKTQSYTENKRINQNNYELRFSDF